ncbi:MAG: YdcF family protein [Eubacteriales bacterium]|nr:YdcF family protein [Eubacteriales bacterium]
MSILDDIGRFVFVSHPPVKADVLFIPGGSSPELMETAAALWHQGYAPAMIPSGKYSIKRGYFAGSRTKTDIYPGPYDTESAFMADVAQRCGVPAEAIWQEPEAVYTMQNAEFSRRITDARAVTVRTALICCKSFHARRVQMYYTLAFPAARLHVIPVDVHGITRQNWYTTDAGVSAVMGELRRIGEQFPGLITRFSLPENPL